MWYNIEYDGLHFQGSSCGCYSHVSRNGELVHTQSDSKGTSTQVGTSEATKGFLDEWKMQALGDLNAHENCNVYDRENQEHKTENQGQITKREVASKGAWLVATIVKKNKKSNRNLPNHQSKK